MKNVFSIWFVVLMAFLSSCNAPIAFKSFFKPKHQAHFNLPKTKSRQYQLADDCLSKEKKESLKRIAENQARYEEKLLVSNQKLGNQQLIQPSELTIRPEIIKPYKKARKKTRKDVDEETPKGKILEPLGLTAFIMVYGFWWLFLTIPVGLALGIASLVKFRNHPEKFSGRGFAISAVIGSGLLVLISLIALAIAIGILVLF